ncbi:hypothetical protein [Psychroserpens luteus]|uniref:Lipocalin-like domain-containing protein n=1 Tax=Psychroserpens luteus TaxID=1434066 RepID=A0ABW5ZPW2_9FLAO|nr:hypothetical protein [Psychroserpens luteus]
MKYTLFAILTYMSLNYLNAQDLNGKWLLKDINIEDNKSYPGFHLLEITGENAILFIDFSMEKKLELKLIDNKLYLLNDKKYADIHFNNSNEIELSSYGISNDKESVFILKFHRLLPTYTSLKISEMEKFTYLYSENKKMKGEFKFNQELLNYENTNKQNKEFREEMRIEKIDSTLFVSIFHYGNRNISFPIKEITNEFIKFYFTPTEDKEIAAFRKK